MTLRTSLGIKALSDILRGYCIHKMTGPKGQVAKCQIGSRDKFRGGKGGLVALGEVSLLKVRLVWILQRTR